MPSHEIKLIGSLASVGFIVGLAKIMLDNQPMNLRTILGRAILSGALGVAAGAIVIFIPEVTFVGQVAMACILTSLGSSALETLLQRIIQK